MHTNTSKRTFDAAMVPLEWQETSAKYTLRLSASPRACVGVCLCACVCVCVGVCACACVLLSGRVELRHMEWFGRGDLAGIGVEDEQLTNRSYL